LVIEHATGGSGADELIGNNVGNVLTGIGGNDILTGNAGNDHLRGGNGNDVMVGGAGYDFFLFNTAPSAATNFGRITDYTPAYDTIQLENAVFTRLPPEPSMPHCSGRPPPRPTATASLCTTARRATCSMT
jgi:Ca2+-binding RTX toxin-like protein